MKKWGIWLRRAAWVTMGLVLMSGSVGGTVFASSETKPTENVGATEGGNAGNEESENSQTSTTLFITNFASLEQDVRLQELEEGEEPNLPDKLDVKVSIKQGADEEEKTNTGAGITNTVLNVTEIAQLPNGNTTISGVTWDKVSTSESNNRVTDTYVSMLPETDEYGNSLQLMNAVAQLPVIQTTRTVMEDSQDDTTGDVGDAGSESDIAAYADTPEVPPTLVNYGIYAVGPENGIIWSSVSKRIQIQKPGRYRITGTLEDIPKELQSTNELFELMEPGNYEIILTDLHVDISDKGYGAIFSIPSGATVNLSTVATDVNGVTLTNSIGGFDRVIKNEGTLNFNKEVKMTCTGEFENTGTMTMKGASELVNNGPFTNTGTMAISESSKLGTFDFENNGKLEINGVWEGNNSSVSTLTAQGRFKNGSGKTVTINEGGLYVNEGTVVKDDKTKDWLIDNSGIMEIINGGSAEAKDIQNRSGGVITVTGQNSVLKADKDDQIGILKNEGEVSANDGAKVQVGMLQNKNKLTIGSDSNSSGLVTIKRSPSADDPDNYNFNTGTIVIESGSVLEKEDTANVTLTNDGSLTIKNKNCLGTGNRQINLAGEGEFILAGLSSDMLHVPDGYGLAYNGEVRTQDVAGNTRTVDSTVEIDDTDESDETDVTDNTKGVVWIDKEWPYSLNEDIKFEIKVIAKLTEIRLFREGKNPESTVSAWSPGIEDADPIPGSTTHTAIVTDIGIRDPGDYTLVYTDTKTGGTATVGFTMTPWSMTINTDRGDDETSKGIYGSDKSAVYENKERITGKIQVAIFNEKAAKGGKTSGTVTLYWNAVDAKNLAIDDVKKTKILPIELDDRGVGTVSFTIETADQDYILPPKLNESDPASWDNEDWAYNHPYYLTGVYETAGGNVYYSGSPATDTHHAMAGVDKELVGWYADKKLIIIRRISTINFTSEYYSLPHIYDGEPLQMPVKLKDVMIGNTNEDEPGYIWYKGTEAAVNEAYDKKSVTGVSGLDPITDQLKAEDLEAPIDAGWYIIEGTLPSTKEYMGSKQLKIIRIEPRNVTISVKDQHKTYGADDPAAWRAFDVTSETNDLYVIEGGILPRDENKIKGDIARQDDKGEACGRYEIKIETYDADSNKPARDNYRFTQRSGYLTIDQRELDWDTEKMFMVITDDNSVSVVGGLKTEYHLNEGEDLEAIEKNLEDDDVLVVYDKLDLSADQTKVTIDKPRLSGVACDNYVIQSKGIPVSVSNLYKVSVKAGGVDSTTLEKLKDSGFDTENQVISEMESQLIGQGVPKGNIAVYDILLTKADGSQLTDEEIRNFPWGALTVTVPYPTGTSRRTSFMAAHMFTEDLALDGPGMKRGNVETRNWSEVAAMEEGVRFQVTSLSPVAIGWSATTPTNPNNPDDPDNPNNGNDGTNSGNNGTNSGTNGNGTNSGSNGNGTDSGTNGTSGTNNGTNSTDNTNKATTTSKTTGSNTTRTAGVKTGDPAEIAFYSIATLIACLLLIVIILLIRAQFRKKE